MNRFSSRVGEFRDVMKDSLALHEDKPPLAKWRNSLWDAVRLHVESQGLPRAEEERLLAVEKLALLSRELALYKNAGVATPREGVSRLLDNYAALLGKNMQSSDRRRAFDAIKLEAKAKEFKLALTEHGEEPAEVKQKLNNELVRVVESARDHLLGSRAAEYRKLMEEIRDSHEELSKQALEGLSAALASSSKINWGSHLN